MKVLLVDDSPKHRRAGKQQLEAAGHSVVALADYGEAAERMGKEKFDVALLDLLMPAEATTLGTDAIRDHVGREIGVGFPLALHAVLSGISRVAIATDTNHHHHPMSAIVDWFGEPFDLHLPSNMTRCANHAKVLVMHAPLTEDGAKDWGKVLKTLCGK